MIDRWRIAYNHHRTHRSLNYQSPAAYAAGCVLPASASAAPQPPEHSRNTNPNSLTQLGAKTGGESDSFLTFELVRGSGTREQAIRLKTSCGQCYGSSAGGSGRALLISLYGVQYPRRNHCFR